MCCACVYGAWPCMHRGSLTHLLGFAQQSRAHRALDSLTRSQPFCSPIAHMQSKSSFLLISKRAYVGFKHLRQRRVRQARGTPLRPVQARDVLLCCVPEDPLEAGWPQASLPGVVDGDGNSCTASRRSREGRVHHLPLQRPGPNPVGVRVPRRRWARARRVQSRGCFSPHGKRHPSWASC
jgi:hypothetical protein